jgi:type I restriction enzyme S subunit
MTIVGKFGISAIVKEECVINQQLHAFLPSNKIIPEFLSYIIFTKTEYLESISSATTIAYINKTKANSLPLNLPLIQEQQEIVSRVESLFAKADIIEKRYKTLKEKIDSLPQAILHKGFKGELVTQLPTDGDAKDLLEEIIKLKKEVKKK